MDLILSQLPGQDKRQAYRHKVQKYATEERRIWEEVRYGLCLGSQAFIDRVKFSLGLQLLHPELPQQKRVLKEEALEVVVEKMAAAFNWEVAELLRSRRGRATRHRERDLLIYALWESGLYSNQEIGQQFGISYSAISRQVSTTKLLLQHDHNSILLQNPRF